MKSQNSRYPNLSPGYSGLRSSSATLNSKYYGNLLCHLSSPSEFNALLETRLPQRVPRLGFFEEMELLEDPEVFAAIRKCRQSVWNLTEKKLDDVQDGETTARYLRLALRLGLADRIARLAPFHNSPELELERLNAKLSVEVSHDLEVDFTGFYQLAKRVSSTDNPKIFTQIHLRILVGSYRYGNRKPELLDRADESALVVENGIPSLGQSFSDQVLLAIIYRGLPMSRRYTMMTRTEMLDKALDISSSLSPKTEQEQLIAAENEYTLRQTLFKWHKFQKQFDVAEQHIRKMIDLDPTDATGHSEFGIYLTEQARYPEALECFSKAIALGPPAVSLNEYLAGNIAAHLGDEAKALALWQASIASDALAVSPRLEIFDLQMKRGGTQAAALTARQILENESLVDQLEPEECERLKAALVSS